MTFDLKNLFESHTKNNHFLNKEIFFFFFFLLLLLLFLKNKKMKMQPPWKTKERQKEGWWGRSHWAIKQMCEGKLKPKMLFFFFFFYNIIVLLFILNNWLRVVKNDNKIYVYIIVSWVKIYRDKGRDYCMKLERVVRG